MAKCDICGDNITSGGRETNFYTAKLLRDDKYQEGDYEKTIKVYGDFLKHHFSICSACNTKNILIAFVSSLVGAFWLFTFVIAPLSKIDFLIPWEFLDKGGFFKLLLVIIIVFIIGLVGTFVIFGFGFTWRSGKLEKKAFEQRGLDLPDRKRFKKLSPFEYNQLQPYKDGFARIGGPPKP